MTLGLDMNYSIAVGAAKGIAFTERAKFIKLAGITTSVSHNLLLLEQYRSGCGKGIGSRPD